MSGLSDRFGIIFIPVILVFLLACGGGGSGSGSSEDDDNNLFNTTLTWELYDRCSDGRGIRVRFFDRTDGGYWPASGGSYSMDAGTSLTVRLSCEYGNKICMGARTLPYDGRFWGLDVDGDESCSSCCTTCDGDTVTQNLRC